MNDKYLKYLSFILIFVCYFFQILLMFNESLAMKKQIVYPIILAFTIFIFTNCNSETSSKESTESVQQQQTLQIKDSIPTLVVDSPKITTEIKSYQRPAPRTAYDTLNWVRILDIDSTIVEDMRYATSDNFVEEIMYNCGACYLRPEAAVAVGKAHKMLKEQGYGGLKMFDCYRPRPVQQKLWDKVPDARYVTPPWKGSMHNRGLAVDLTIIDSLGNQLNMGTRFDYFGKEGYHTYTGHSIKIQANRTLLKETLNKVGFRHIRTEWWHYSFRKVTYPVSDWLWDCQ